MEKRYSKLKRLEKEVKSLQKKCLASSSVASGDTKRESEENGTTKLIRTKPSEEQQELNKKLVDLRKGYAGIIIDDPAFALEKGLDQALWKTFYRRIEKERKHLRDNDCGEFLNFVDSGKDFYQSLATRLEKIEQNEVNDKVLYDCYLKLGDLCRYREHHDKSLQRKTYKKAERWYIQALELCPWNGHPHNQIGVLASYTERPCIMLYHSVRSVCTKEPYLRGLGQLSLHYDLILRAERETKAMDEPVISAGLLVRSSERNALRKGFLARFCVVHAYLHTETELDGVERCIERVKTEMPILLRTSALSRDMQIAMLIICVFAMRTTNRKDARAENLAKQLGFTLLTIMAEHANVSVSTRIPLLGPISIFTDWLSTEIDLVVEDISTPHVQNFLRALALEWDELVKLARTAPLSAAIARQPLSEEKALNGFLPLESLYEPFLSVRDQVLIEKQSHPIRAAKIVTFCRRLYLVVESQHMLPFHMPDQAELQQLIPFPPPSLVRIPTLNIDDSEKSESNVQNGEKNRDGPEMQAQLENDEEEDEIILLRPDYTDSDPTRFNNHPPSFAHAPGPISQLFGPDTFTPPPPPPPPPLSLPMPMQGYTSFTPFVFNTFSANLPQMNLAMPSNENRKPQWNHMAFAQPPQPSTNSAMLAANEEAKNSRFTLPPPPGFT